MLFKFCNINFNILKKLSTITQTLRDRCFHGFVYKQGRRGTCTQAMAGANGSWVVSSVFRNNLFCGKTAIVTGGGTGIGRAITQELLYLGC